MYVELRRTRVGQVLLDPVRVLSVLLAGLLVGCAARTPPPLPSTPSHPDFVAPAVPVALRGLPAATRVDAGWRYLQNDDLRNADREFNAAIRRSPTLYPARTGEGYVALARREYNRAIAAFDAALSASDRYVPALVGRGLALLAARRDTEALATFEAALAADPSLADVRRRVEVLRFRSFQEVIEAARAAAAAGRLDEARAAYERAVTASPESPFLHRELGIVERRAGQTGAALERFRRAADLDPSDAVSLVQLGELLEQRQDFEGALMAYRKAAETEASRELEARIGAAAEKARDAKLPAEFRAIPASNQITRGELAALIGVRLDELVREAPERQIVVTDARDHWAQPWIAEVAAAGVLEPFENHTFQPRNRVRRVDLAAAVARLVALAANENPSLRTRLAERPAIADVSPGHLSYPAVATAVASGVMPLLEGQRFQVGRAVTGAEAIETIDRIRQLTGR